ncbi:hypothetical protein QJS10_CPB18g01533 [Acorus calamus]|uniref:acetyl-CoA carboxytransferase n=1 Tax=Acorus calamus TaxID=4465 RepID=A0AAV9CNM4_ACOCL|nr:hypothetical protein QJS10_CPB18g01533 [Acorus calamus]
MSSLSISFAINGGKESLGSSDLVRTRLRGISGFWWRKPVRDGVWRDCRFDVSAKIKKGKKHDYPWPEDIDPNLKSGYLKYLSRFKPLAEKPKPVTLEFEKPVIEIEKKISDVRKMADETGLDFSEQIKELERKYQQVLKGLYTHLTPFERLQIARHPHRPTVLDHIANMTDQWVELHGNRLGFDDPAIVTALGSMDGKSYMFIGQQKGRNTNEHIRRNFGMPTPHGYRKALRMMKYADHHGFPIITFVDTPGAFADLKSEELGQGEAIAHNLWEMFGLKVPVVTVIIGEGGSGGALAIACANKLFMLENSVFYVASPEACAAILWKSAREAPKAAEKLKITATELCKFQIADGIIPEPLRGAHTDALWTSQQIKLVVTKAIEELEKMDKDELLKHRMLKYRRLGGFVEGASVDPEKKRNFKKQDVDITQVLSEIETDFNRIKKKFKEAEGGPPRSISTEALEELRKELDQEMANAFISIGLQEKLEAIKLEFAESSGNSSDQSLSPGLKERVDKLVQEFNSCLSRPGSYVPLKQKLKMVTEANKMVELKNRENLEKEINEKIQEEAKKKMEILRMAHDKVVKGEQLDDELNEKVEQARTELKEMLKLASLEANINQDTDKEIQRTIDAAGLRGMIDELNGGIVRNPSGEITENLYEEIRAGIVAIMDLPELNEKFEDVIEELTVDTMGENNGGI